MKRHRTLYLSPEITYWSPRVDGGSMLSFAEKRRAYNHLQRAESFLSLPTPCEADFADCLANLRRSLTQRLRLLEKHYKLRSSLNLSAKRHFLEILAQFGVIRPLLLKALLDARNATEYNDRRPPGSKRCHEFVDAVWYFLRTTDPIVSVLREDFGIHPPGTELFAETYWLSFRTKYSPRFKMEVFGWLPSTLVSDSPKEKWLLVESVDQGTREERFPNSTTTAGCSDDVFLRGRVSRDQATVTALVSLAFAAD